MCVVVSGNSSVVAARSSHYRVGCALGLSDEMCKTVVILTCLASLLDNFAMRLTMLNFTLQPTL
jgi:hypothetical protein